MICIKCFVGFLRFIVNVRPKMEDDIERCLLILCAWMLAVAAGVLGDQVVAQEKLQYMPDVGIETDDVTLGKKEYSPYLHRAFPQHVLWGDTHLHTSYSTDAGMIGNFLGPEEAFRFARGETVRAEPKFSCASS